LTLSNISASKKALKYLKKIDSYLLVYLYNGLIEGVSQAYNSILLEDTQSIASSIKSTNINGDQIPFWYAEFDQLRNLVKKK